LKASFLTLLLPEGRDISDPLPIKGSSIERAYEAPLAESAARCASRGYLIYTNGTRAFYACPEGSTRLAGGFYNARAVTARALAIAREHESTISLVCSGELNYFALDDAVCSWYLALELQRQQGPEKPLHLDESALVAIALYEAYSHLK
jgi:phosphosulfolactate phosphohydrolase-like enzyme